MAGHLAATLVHLANIAARVGRVLNFDPRSETIQGDPEAAALVTRRYRDGHWAVPRGINVTERRRWCPIWERN